MKVVGFLVFGLIALCVLLGFAFWNAKYTVILENQSSTLVEEIIVSGAVQKSVSVDLGQEESIALKIKLPENITHKGYIEIRIRFADGRELVTSEDVISNHREIRVVIGENALITRVIVAGYL